MSEPTETPPATEVIERHGETLAATVLLALIIAVMAVLMACMVVCIAAAVIVVAAQ